MRKVRLIKRIAFALAVVLITATTPASVIADNELVNIKIDIKSQANGVVYMENEGVARQLDVGAVNKTVDFIPSDGLASDTLEAMHVADRELFSSYSVPFDIAPKRTDMADLSDKEAIVVKASGANNVAVNIPSGYYKEVYFVGFSGVKESGTPKVSIKLSYNGSNETKVQPIYGYSQTYDTLESAEKIAGSRRIEMCTWAKPYDATAAYLASPVNYYIYKITTDDTKVLEGMTFTATDSATAIIGMTGKLDLVATKAYVEDVLDDGNTVIANNVVLLNDMVNTLVQAGIVRSDIQGIEALDNVRIPVGNKYIKMDVKSQANGLIYMDNRNEAKAVNPAKITKNDFLPYIDLERSNYDTYSTSCRGQLTSAAFGETVVPFDVTQKRVGSNMNDKEAIIVQDGIDNSTYTIEVPDGCYEELYFVAMSTTNSTGNPSAEIVLAYDGEESTVTQPIYDSKKVYESISMAVVAGSTQKFIVTPWDVSQAYDSVDSKIYAYKIEGNSAKYLRNIKITVKDCATAIVAMTGVLNGDATIEYLEETFGNLDETEPMELISLKETVELLESNGVDTETIAGISDFYDKYESLFYIDSYETSNDLAKWFAEIMFTNPVDETTVNAENIVVTKGAEMLKDTAYEVVPIMDNSECRGITISGQHSFDFNTSYTVQLKKGLKSTDEAELAADWQVSFTPKQSVGISELSVLLGDDNNITATATIKCGADAAGKTYAAFIGMYSEDNALLDYAVKTGTAESTDIPFDTNFTSPGTGVYSFKCILLDSYSGFGLFDKVQEYTLEIEE